MYFLNWAIPGLLFYVHPFSTVSIKSMKNKIYPLMTGFELWIPGVGSDRSTNWATATSHLQCLIIDMKSFFKKKWANPGLFFVYFRSFQTNNTIFTTNQCEKISIQYTVPGLNPQPLIHESSSITTRPGLLPNRLFLCHKLALHALKRWVCILAATTDA